MPGSSPVAVAARVTIPGSADCVAQFVTDTAFVLLRRLRIGFTSIYELRHAPRFASTIDEPCRTLTMAQNPDLQASILALVGPGFSVPPP